MQSVNYHTAWYRISLLMSKGKLRCGRNELVAFRPLICITRRNYVSFHNCAYAFWVISSYFPSWKCTNRFCAEYEYICPIYLQLIKKLDNTEECITYLQNLGKKHVMYGADKELIHALAWTMFDCIHSFLEKEVSKPYGNRILWH